MGEQDRKLATLAGSLMVLRGRALARPGESSTGAVGRLQVAWKVDAQTRVEALGLRAGGPLSDTQLGAVLAAIPEELVPFERRDGATGTLYRMRVAKGCARCGWPVDVAAKVAAKPTCSVCADLSQTRCTGCGYPMQGDGEMLSCDSCRRIRFAGTATDWLQTTWHIGTGDGMPHKDRGPLGPAGAQAYSRTVRVRRTELGEIEAEWWDDGSPPGHEYAVPARAGEWRRMTKVTAGIGGVDAALFAQACRERGL